MSSEELRQAAGLMRERAEAAGVQPWEPNDALTRNPLSESGATYIRHEVRGPHKGDDWPFIAEANATQYAVHIASWHPTVALAVADWLDQEAEAFDAHMARQADPKRRFNTLWLELSRQRHEHALAVARAYLGTAS
jgi:hypothetical protein